ncbi:hypothetical protein M3Y99_01694200 [Aphelenchoides fujianensis]|nr:hypothetical protein M3Y99_01694200 [Aphelenchoides fujianensis]
MLRPANLALKARLVPLVSPDNLVPLASRARPRRAKRLNPARLDRPAMRDPLDLLDRPDLLATMQDLDPPVPRARLDRLEYPPGNDGNPGAPGQPGQPGAAGEKGICPKYCAIDGGVFFEDGTRRR